MSKIDQIHFGTACATPADVERALEQATAPVSDIGPSNRNDGRPSWIRQVNDPRCSSAALTALPFPQAGWCRILMRSLG
jgi:hypothetical protein